MVGVNVVVVGVFGVVLYDLVWMSVVYLCVDFGLVFCVFGLLVYGWWLLVLVVVFVVVVVWFLVC